GRLAHVIFSTLLSLARVPTRALQCLGSLRPPGQTWGPKTAPGSSLGGTSAREGGGTMGVLLGVVSIPCLPAGWPRNTTRTAPMLKRRTSTTAMSIHPNGRLLLGGGCRWGGAGEVCHRDRSFSCRVACAREERGPFEGRS